MLGGSLANSASPRGSSARWAAGVFRRQVLTWCFGLGHDHCQCWGSQHQIELVSAMRLCPCFSSGLAAPHGQLACSGSSTVDAHLGLLRKSVFGASLAHLACLCAVLDGSTGTMAFPRNIHFILCFPVSKNQYLAETASPHVLLPSSSSSDLIACAAALHRAAHL